ncbi:MAG: hypothetical protein AAFP68_20040, partial [Pseudomonadota bacterium]
AAPRALREARYQPSEVDQDGAVTLDEMKAMKRQRGSEDRMSRRFARADTNGNGAIERTEFEDVAERRFERTDANGDGALTLDEIREHRQKRHKTKSDG